MSNLIKRKRSLSDMQFYINAIKIRRVVTYLLLKDFGVRDKVRKREVIFDELDPEDEFEIHNILSKYDDDNSYVKVFEQYPEWFLDDTRENIMDLLNELIMNITHANTIYPSSFEEFHERRRYQTDAIVVCEQLLQEFQYVIDIIPLDANKFMTVVDMIETEIVILRGWRKSGNAILKQLNKKRK